MSPKCYVVCENLQKLQMKSKWSNKYQTFLFIICFQICGLKYNLYKATISLQRCFGKLILSLFFFFFSYCVACVQFQSHFHDAASVNTFFHKVVSIISKIYCSFPCKYASDAFIMSAEKIILHLTIMWLRICICFIVLPKKLFNSH